MEFRVQGVAVCNKGKDRVLARPVIT